VHNPHATKPTGGPRFSSNSHILHSRAQTPPKARLAHAFDTVSRRSHTKQSPTISPSPNHDAGRRTSSPPRISSREMMRRGSCASKPSGKATYALGVHECRILVGRLTMHSPMGRSYWSRISTVMACSFHQRETKRRATPQNMRLTCRMRRMTSPGPVSLYSAQSTSSSWSCVRDRKVVTCLTNNFSSLILSASSGGPTGQ